VISSFSLHPTFRPYWGFFDAYAEDQFLPAIHDSCFVAKWYKAPETNREIIPASTTAGGGYLRSVLQITPSSIIMGFYHNFTDGVGGTSGLGQGDGYLVSITDMSLNHKITSDPVPDYMLGNYNGGMPNLLCAPYPVVGSGAFAFEFFNPTSSPLRCQLVVAVLEACQCLF
jgi:hypothetical protein